MRARGTVLRVFAAAAPVVVAILAIPALHVWNPAPAAAQDRPAADAQVIVQPEVADKIRRLRTAWDAQDTDRAVRLAEDLLRNHGEAVHPPTGDDLVEARIYVGVTTLVRDILAGLPAPMLEAWREETRAAAERVLQRARMVEGGPGARAAALEQVAVRHPLTEAAATAMLEAAEISIAAGRLHHARAVLDDLMATPRVRPEVIARAALLQGPVLAQLGDDAGLDALRSRLGRAGDPVLEGPDGGRTSPARLLEGLRARPVPASAGDLPHPADRTAGAILPGDRHGPPAGSPELLWTAEVEPIRSRTSYGFFGMRAGGSRYDHPLVASAAAGGMLVTSDGREVLCRTLAGGDLLWRRRSPDWMRLQRSLEDRAYHDENQVHFVSVDRDMVFASEISSHTSETEWRGYPIQTALVKRRLVALDLADGTERWTYGGLLNEGEDAREDTDAVLSVACPPAVLGDRVYVVGAEYRYSTDYPVMHLSCLDRATGEVMWRTRLVSGQQEVNMFGNPLREPIPLLPAVHDGRVLVCTNVGAVCAVNARTGETEWIRRYPRVKMPTSQNLEPQRRDAGWRSWPMVVAGGRVLVAPLDSDALLSLRLADGSLEGGWIEPRHRLRRLLGVLTDPEGERPDLVVLTGTSRVVLRHLRDGYEVSTVRTTDDITGAGFIGDDGHVWVPVRQEGRREVHLLAAPVEVDRRGDGAWGEPLLLDGFRPDWKGGHLQPVDGMLVVSGTERVSVWGDLRAAADRLGERAGDGPGRPAVRFKRALLLQAAGRGREALEDMRAAHALAGGAGPWADPTVAAQARSRLFDLHLQVASAAPDADTASEQLDRALEYAGGPVDRVRVGAVRALMLAAVGRPTEAMEEWHRLGTMHGSVVLDGRPVAEQARDRIADLIRRVGREAYAPLESRARALLERGRAGDIASLESLLEHYPNAEAVPEAWLALGEARLEAGEFGAAADAMKEFLHGHPEHAREADALALLIEAREAEGRSAVAKGLLLRLARTHPDATLTRHGDEAAGAWAERRLAQPRYENIWARSLPPVFTPPDPRPRWVVEGGSGRGFGRRPRLVRVPDRSPEGWEDLVLIQVDERLECWNNREAEAVWTQDGRGWYHGRLTPRAAILFRNLGDAGGVRAFGRRDGVGWSREFPGEHITDMLLDDDGAQAIVFSLGVRERDGRAEDVLVVRSLNTDDGSDLWTHTEVGATHRGPQVAGGLVQYTAFGGAGRRVVLLDAADGSVLRTLESQPGRPRRGEAFLVDGVLIVPEQEGGIAAYDPRTGALLWDGVWEDMDAGSLQAVEDRLLAVIGGREILCLDPADGTERWRRDLGRGEDIREVHGTFDAVFILSEKSEGPATTQIRIHAVSLSGGAPLWRALVGVSSRGGGFAVRELRVTEGHVLAAVRTFQMGRPAMDRVVAFSRTRQGRRVAEWPVPGEDALEYRVVGGGFVAVKGTWVYGYPAGRK